MRYSLDTSTVIEILRENKKVINKFLEISTNNEIVICPAVYYELYRGFEVEQAYKQQDLFEKLCKRFYIPEVNDLEVMKKAAFIYIQAKKKGKPTKQQDIDFIIAAWSLYVDSIVVTLNTKDFDTIDGLQITNWGVK